MNKRVFSVIALVLIAEFSLSQQYWISVPSPTTKDFYKCHLIDTVYGWAAGDSGIIVHTSNSGSNWIVQNSGIQYQIDDIFFINERVGWAIANDFLFFGTTILRTTNGGTNWTNSRYPDTTKVFNTIYFLDSITGFLSGYTGQILKTTNSGTNWFECHVDTAYCSILYMFPKWDITFANANTGFVCGGQIDIQGIVWRTTDAGLNWFTYCIAPEPLLEIKAVSQSKIVATGGDPDYGISFVKSYDGGLTWSYQETGHFGMGRSLAFRTPSELWVPGFFFQKFALNLDSGNASSTWFEINPAVNFNLNASQFVTPTYGWTFGGGGTILKYNNAVISVGNNSTGVPEDFTLEQNYPNPFNPVTKITFGVPGQSSLQAELRIYDAIGRVISEPVKGAIHPGLHTIEFDGTDYPSGIYFYTLSVRNKDNTEFKLTRKMVLLK